MGSNGNIPANLPIFDGKNWDQWCSKMRVIFNFQEVGDYVDGGYAQLGENPTEAQRTAHKAAKKNDQKALFYIHQCVNSKVFDKISESKTSKEAWDLLTKYYGGDSKVKKVRLQSLRRQYELLQMKSDESIADYLSRLGSFTSQMKSNGEDLTEQSIVEKVLRTLTPKFDMIVVAIEETKDLSQLKLEDLQSTLEARELRVTDREAETEIERALMAQSKKGSFDDKKKKWKKGKFKSQKENFSSKEKSDLEDRPEPSSTRGGDSRKFSGKKKTTDRSQVQCFRCEKFGHYAYEYKKFRGGSNKGKTPKKAEEEANLVQDDSDSDPVMLMATTCESGKDSEVWYF
ncbi:uncharacterized protein LOC130717434 [Lotus japonicus]|uniref:uncharacterized protein LOC130717434 n=1 Tax=Lotus japonicus TaxID=34305 RepID=UPI00258A9529|nr:uncharacterized protein LOC130717434 [Lotus japonicus]